MGKLLLSGFLATAAVLAAGNLRADENSLDPDGDVVLTPLSITDFTVVEVEANLWTLHGTVTGADPADLIIWFDGAVVNQCYVDENGSFTLTVELSPDVEGIVTAEAWTWWGQCSNVAEYLIGP